MARPAPSAKKSILGSCIRSGPQALRWVLGYSLSKNDRHVSQIEYNEVNPDRKAVIVVVVASFVVSELSEHCSKARE